jgi:hypothetical protein
VWFSLLLVSLLATALPAAASPLAEIAIEREPVAIWLDTTFTDPVDGPLRVKVFTPLKDGERTLWQVCSFPSGDAGPYRCGLDREAVEREEGRWIVRATMDGDTIGRRSLWIR